MLNGHSGEHCLISIKMPMSFLLGLGKKINIKSTIICLEIVLSVFRNILAKSEKKKKIKLD